ncbi:DegT/DnrJ/EryC1/StrS family aminotransferase [Candidatus Pelagibacter sp.]|nr:DegT/DnrJ/EryC1/StrS family aminotransferase [Candidatus Pelagibacter sp.]
MISVNKTLLKGNEKKYLLKCLSDNWISSSGYFLNKFESGLSKYLNKKFAVSVSNGTAALEVAVNSLNLKKGDEIIMPTFTIISCANAIIKSGLKPVLVDCNYDDWNMDLNNIEEKITNRTRAILVVHIYGMSVNMKKIMQIKKKYNLKIIEDNSEGLGLDYDGKKCGSFADITTLSFYANKIVTTGEGGMVLCNKKSIYKRSLSIKNLFFKEPRFVHDEIGSNFRLTNLQAALGLAQLETIKKSIKRKIEIGNLYNKLLEEISCINIPVKKNRYSKNIYWVYGIVLNNKCKLSKKTIMQRLKNKNIETRSFFSPMHTQPVYKKMGLFKGLKFKNSEMIYKKGFYLPCGIGITNKEIFTVCKVLKKILN